MLSSQDRELERTARDRDDVASSSGLPASRMQLFFETRASHQTGPAATTATADGGRPEASARAVAPVMAFCSSPKVPMMRRLNFTVIAVAPRSMRAVFCFSAAAKTALAHPFSPAWRRDGKG